MLWKLLWSGTEKDAESDAEGHPPAVDARGAAAGSDVAFGTAALGLRPCSAVTSGDGEIAFGAAFPLRT